MVKKAAWPVLAGMVFFLSHAALAGMFQDFAFERADQKVDAGSIGAVLSGTKGKDEGDSYRGSPYSLQVTMTLDAKQVETGCSTTLQSLSLTKAKGGEEVFYTVDKPGQFHRGKQGNPVASFSFDDIAMPYEDYLLNVSFTLTGCPSKAAGEMKQTAKLAFKKHYVEKQKSVMDALRGL